MRKTRRPPTTVQRTNPETATPDDAAALEAALVDSGVLVERVGDALVYGRGPRRRLARVTGWRAARQSARAEAARAADPLVAGLAAMPHVGAAQYVARTYRDAPTPELEARARGHREARAARQRALAERRAVAHAAGYRRLSRWAAAGSPTTLPAGRTPYRAAS